MTSLGKRSGVAAALFCLLTGGFTVAPPAPAQAQGLFEFLFNPQRYEQRRRYRELGERIRQPGGERTFYVSSPKYYTYKPDVPRAVSLAPLAEPKPAPQTEAPAAPPRAYAELPTDAVPEELATADDAALPGAADATPAAGQGAFAGAEAAANSATLDTDSSGNTDMEAAPAPAEPAAAPTPFERDRAALASLRLRALPEVADAVIAHYREHPAFLWVDDGAVSARARAVLDALGRADRFGLSAEDYRVALPGEATGAIGDDAPADAGEAHAVELMAFEMELSAAALTYVLDTTRGRIDPNRLSGYHDLPRKQVDLTAALAGLAAARDPAGWLEARNPQGAHFRALTNELARLRAADERADRIEIADGTFIRPGASSPEIYNVVAAIYKRSSDDLKATHAETLSTYAGSDKYTPELVALVRDFQRGNGLQPDGVIGPNTIRALTGLSNADKIDKLVLAMERARWLPDALGRRHVFINQAAFRATYAEEGRVPLSMKVVVGTKANQTNFFMDEIETVEFNPYWGVPYSIIVNEMLPHLAQDPSYLDRLGYEVTNSSGRQVSSSSVDWYGVANKQVSVDVRQPPGRSNALGELKILFPNKHDIYMHDTPAKNLFQRDMRAYSHGCVRLEDPRAMAAAVLGKSVDYVASRVAQGRNDSDTLAQKVPVYVAYFTAWPEADGSVRYYNDVYGRDEHLLEALQMTRKTRRAEG